MKYCYGDFWLFCDLSLDACWLVVLFDELHSFVVFRVTLICGWVGWLWVFWRLFGFDWLF